jgi:hypothetical protein
MIGAFPAATEIAGGLAVFGPLLIYTVPARVDGAEIRELAVQSSIEGRFSSQCWWQLQIEEGATQEVVFYTEGAPAALFTGAYPPRTSGFQFGRYGSLHKPEKLTVQLRQGQRVIIPIFTVSGVQLLNLTVYVRVRGVIFQTVGASE